MMFVDASQKNRLKQCVKFNNKRKGATKMTLRELRHGQEFKLGEYKFIKLDDNEECFIITTGSIFESEFGETDDFAKSVILARLEDEVLPKIEELVGANNVLEFESNLKAFDNRNKYLSIKGRISIPSFDQYTSTKGIDVPTWNETKYWLSTSYQGECLCIGAYGTEEQKCSSIHGVRPLLKLNSNIEVEIMIEEPTHDDLWKLFGERINSYHTWTATN